MPLVQIGELDRDLRLRKKFTIEDALAVRDRCPSVRLLTPVLDAPTMGSLASYRDEQVDTPRLRGVYANDLELAHRVLKEGRFFTEQENRHRSAVVVLGFAADEALFPNGGAVGKRVLIDGRRYTVSGTLEKRKNLQEACTHMDS